MSVHNWDKGRIAGQYLLEALPWSQIVEAGSVVQLLGVGATGGWWGR
jgi:hypothetical protein